MITIKRQDITYNSAELNTPVSHCILVANHKKKQLLLSHANLYLYYVSRKSIATSRRYASIILMFYRFLSTQPHFANIDPAQYHVIADNRDIRRWKVQRQIDRVARGSLRPTTETTSLDATVLLFYFRWLKDNKFVTNVDVALRTWQVKFKSPKMLNYIQLRARVSIDSRNIDTLDRASRQKVSRDLISNREIETLLKSYNDPVYAAMFLLAMGTAMRPMDLCNFPYVGNGKNKHIMPFSDMAKSGKTVKYRIEASKGNKSRTITLNMSDLEALENIYIREHYYARRGLYKKRFGHECPLDVLFLNSRGIPVTPHMVATRTYVAKQRAMQTDPEFRPHLSFYESRHWWPTKYLIEFFGDKLLTEYADGYFQAAAQALADQMGHSSVETTYKYYVNMARVVMDAHAGRVQELISAPSNSVIEFLHLFDDAKLEGIINTPDDEV